MRDAFGLFPVDLVPPELLMSAAEIEDNLHREQDQMKPSTARARRCFALQHLRERKAVLQDQQVRGLRGGPKTEAVGTTGNQEEDAPRVGEFYVTFEPRRDHLSIDLDCNMGHVHERGAALHVNYRLPQTEMFLNGYFQLIWRELGDARSEEPHYDPRVTKLRDESARFLDQEAPLQSIQQLPDQDSQTQQTKEEAAAQIRALDGPKASSVIVGCFPVDVTQLPADSVCQVLFVACDRHMLHRTIALSTEGLAIQTADIEDLDSDDYYSDTTSEEDEDEEGTAEEKQEAENQQPGYTFFVGGEEFSHPNSVFAGRSFPDVESFEVFLRDLRVKKQRRLQERQEQLEKEVQREQQMRQHDQVDQEEQQQQEQRQEAGQEAEEVASKSDDTEPQGTQQQDEVRPAENPADTTKNHQSNQADDEEAEQ
ncbi:hypothetical protein ON010_g16355 [Phytophthora cinnamomi]|nr:hypothetical protein ON010_g16355 [Phytophthora cinnamomi]